MTTLKPSAQSPKRKRSSVASPIIPPTPPSSSPVPDMANNADSSVEPHPGPIREGSPRTKVAYTFQGLHLDDSLQENGALSPGPRQETSYYISRNNSTDARREEETVRKRVRVFKDRNARGQKSEVPETPSPKVSWADNKFTISFGPERVLDPGIMDAAAGVILSNEVDPVVFKGSQSFPRIRDSGLGRAYPSINRLADSRSRQARAPAARGISASIHDTMTIEEREMIDVDRASLTWHDDEITGHDPTDPDDDGEGMNGIGFRPTPAEAYQRAQRRRQQMAEYQSREAREARKLRMEKRKGDVTMLSSRPEQDPSRRVRFNEELSTS